MTTKFTQICFFLAICTGQNIAAEQLESYDSLKAHLLDGSEVKLIVDYKKNCVVEYHNGSIPINPYGTIVGLNIHTFIHENLSGDIELQLSHFNAPDEKYSANYEDVEISISPNETIKIMSKAVGLQDYKVFSTTIRSCVFGNKKREGVRFLLISPTHP